MEDVSGLLLFTSNMNNVCFLISSSGSTTYTCQVFPKHYQGWKSLTIVDSKTETLKIC